MIDTQPFYIVNELHDFEEATELLKTLKWNYELKKLDPAAYRSHSQMLSFGKVQVSRTKSSNTLLQNGFSSKGYRTFVFFATDTQKLIWMNQELNTNDLIVYREDNFWESISHDGFDMFTVDIEKDYLQSMIEESEVLNCSKNLRFNEQIVRLDKATVVRLRKFLNELFFKLELNTLNIYSPNLRNKILYKLPQILLNAIDASTDKNPPKKKRKRDVAISKALEYLKETNYSKVLIPDLCSYSGVSERTLEYGFQEKFSVSPLQYAKAIKLNEVRAALISSPNNPLVSEIAREHGFHHMGQFAADYKTFFGETPRDTLLKTI